MAGDQKKNSTSSASASRQPVRLNDRYSDKLMPCGSTDFLDCMRPCAVPARRTWTTPLGESWSLDEGGGAANVPLFRSAAWDQYIAAASIGMLCRASTRSKAGGLLLHRILISPLSPGRGIIEHAMLPAAHEPAGRCSRTRDGPDRVCPSIPAGSFRVTRRVTRRSLASPRG